MSVDRLLIEKKCKFYFILHIRFQFSSASMRRSRRVFRQIHRSYLALHFPERLKVESIDQSIFLIFVPFSSFFHCYYILLTRIDAGFAYTGFFVCFQLRLLLVREFTLKSNDSVVQLVILLRLIINDRFIFETMSEIYVMYFKNKDCESNRKNKSKKLSGIN